MLLADGYNHVYVILHHHVSIGRQLFLASSVIQFLFDTNGVPLVGVDNIFWEQSSMEIKSCPFPAQPPGLCSLLVHGGAWDIPEPEWKDHQQGVKQALERGRALLLEGQSALDVVTATVMELEAHGAFDAGRGAVLTREGKVELDAGLMNGASMSFGSIAAVQHLAHPIHVARTLLEQGQGEVRLMTGRGAERFAEEHGFSLISNEALICEREQARFERLQQRPGGYHTSHPFIGQEPSSPRGTVGCVARDREGRLAAATSTGGTPFRPGGRIGDSPLPGCGFYANGKAAASATGWGEAIATVLLCGRSVDGISEGRSPEESAIHHLRTMHAQVKNQEGRGATGGLIILSESGEGAWAYTTPRMARGGWYEGGDLWVDI